MRASSLAFLLLMSCAFQPREVGFEHVARVPSGAHVRVHMPSEAQRMAYERRIIGIADIAPSISVVYDFVNNPQADDLIAKINADSLAEDVRAQWLSYVRGNKLGIACLSTCVTVDALLTGPQAPASGLMTLATRCP